MKLPENLRVKFKEPLGELIPEKQTTKENIQKYLPEDAYIITVGDRTTEKMIEYGIIPSLQIVDSKEKRVKRKLPKTKVKTDLTCTNPAAEITPSALELIKNAFDMKTPVRILVDGEEDLLVLPVCIYAPHNAIVMYGQPNEGLVIVKITPEIRNNTQELLELME